MTQRRLMRWSLIIVVLAAFAVWLEPTRVVWGWLRGEAFYDGRPTSWWAAELNSHSYCFTLNRGDGTIFVIASVVGAPPPDDPVKLHREGWELAFWRKPNWLAQTWHDISTGGPITLEGYAPTPTLLAGDSSAEPVLRALEEQDSPALRIVVLNGLMNIAKRAAPAP